MLLEFAICPSFEVGTARTAFGFGSGWDDDLEPVQNSRALGLDNSPHQLHCTYLLSSNIRVTPLDHPRRSV